MRPYSEIRFNPLSSSLKEVAAEILRRANLNWLGLLSVVIFAAPTVVNAQEVLLSPLTVNVVDQSGAIIPRAKVFVLNPGTGQKASAVTDGDGTAVLTLQPGIYGLSVQACGFEDAKKEVDFPKVSLVDLTLKVSNSTYNVNVYDPCLTAERPRLETTQPVVTALVEPGKRRWFAFHRASSDALTQNEPQ